MKQRIKNVFIILFTFLLIMSNLTMPVDIHASEDSMLSNDCYGRSVLAKMDNAKALLYAYDKIVDGVEKNEKSISVYNGKNNISKEEFVMVMDIYRRDNGHHFWVDSAYFYYYENNTVTKVKPMYLFEGEALTKAKAAFNKSADAILSGIKSTMSEFEKELYIHDKLASKVSYVFGDHADDAYGALVEGKAVCEGYTEAFQYLLRRAGIQSFMVIGSSFNPSTEKKANHAWNYVRINNKYYHVDLTWNDQGNKLYHSYFNLSDSAIKEDHTILSTSYDLPVCKSSDAQYFKVKGRYLDSYSVASVGKLLKNNNLKTSVYVSGSVSSFMNWYNNNIVSIAAEAGVKCRFTYSYSYLGREVMISLQPNCSHSYVTRITPATLSKNGKTLKECKYCGIDASTSTIYRPTSFALSTTKYPYNGKVKTPSITVKDSKGKKLTYKTDYTVSYESGRKNIGEYTVTIKFKGKYSGTKKLYFTIVPGKVGNLKASSQTTSTITLKWDKVAGSVRYKVYRYNTSKKKYVYLGSTSSTTYKVSGLSSGITCKFKVRAYKKVDGATFDGSYSNTLTTGTKTKTPTLKSISSPSTGKVKLTWSNVSGETRYQIYYSTKKTSGYKILSSLDANTTTKTLTNLTSKKTYYFKVRTYKLVDGKKIYSAYSSIKSIKVK